MDLDDCRLRLETALSKEREVKSLLEQRKELIALSFTTVGANEKKMQDAIALRSRAEAVLKKEKQKLEAVRSEMVRRQQEVDAKKAEVEELVKTASEQVSEGEARAALVQVQRYLRGFLRPAVLERVRAGNANIPKFSSDEEMERFLDEKVQERCTLEVRWRG